MFRSGTLLAPLTNTDEHRFRSLRDGPTVIPGGKSGFAKGRCVLARRTGLLFW
jgi:hypothetical protein